MRKKFILFGSILCVVIIFTVLFYRFNYSKNKAEAAGGPSNNVIGWAWNSNVGWASMGCKNDYYGKGVIDDYCSILFDNKYDGGGIDQSLGIAVDSNNNIIVTGYKHNGSNYDYYTIKYDSSGNPVGGAWPKTYDSGRNDYATGVAIDSNNNVIVTGYTNNGSNNDYYTIKYDSSGNPVGGAWPKTYNSGSGDQANGVAIDSNNNVIVMGISNGNFVTIKYDSSGNPVGGAWPKTYDSGSVDYAGGVAVDSNNNIIITGYGGFGNYNYITVKYDSSGNPLWTPAERTYDSGGTNDRARTVAVDSNDNIIVTGEGARPSSPTALDFITIKYDKNGNQLGGNWPKFYDTNFSNDQAFGVVVDSNDNIIVTGGRSTGSVFEFYTIKYDNDGNKLWDAAYDGGYNNAFARGVAVDSFNNIIVTGATRNASGNYDYKTIKYDNSGSGGYGVNIPSSSGNATGYAWSPNIGWIRFDPAAPYPDNPPGLPNYPTYYDSTVKTLSGWAKIVNSDFGDSAWLKLQGPVTAPPVSGNYALCRSCSGINPNKICDFCYEFSADGGSGKIGVGCTSCSGVPPAPNTCNLCSNTYLYGVSALPYSIKDEGIKYIFEGWAGFNKDTDNKSIGWLHFNYAYANSNKPKDFDNFSAVPSQTNPPSACKGADLRWELSSWANKYEVQRSDSDDLPQDCNAVSYPNSFFIDPSACTYTDCSYQDPSLDENKYYCYRVLSWNDRGSTLNSDGSKQIKTPLCAPSNFTADNKICGEITLNWTDKTAPAEETNYKIYRSLTDVDATSSAALLGTLPVDTIKYKDENIVPRQNYYYLLTAISSVGDESPPAKVSGRTLCYKGADWQEK